MSLSWCQINLIDFNFHLKKSLETFDKKSADRFQSKQGYKNDTLMPIRVGSNEEKTEVAVELSLSELLLKT